LLRDPQQQQVVTPPGVSSTHFTPSRPSSNSFWSSARSRVRTAFSALTPNKKQSSVDEKASVRSRIFNSTTRSSLAASGAQAEDSPSASLADSLSLTAGLAAFGAQAPVHSSVGSRVFGARANSSSLVNSNLAVFGAQVPVHSSTQFPPSQKTYQPLSSDSAVPSFSSLSFVGGAAGSATTVAPSYPTASRVVTVPSTLFPPGARTYTAPALSTQPVFSTGTQLQGASSAGYRLDPLASSFTAGTAGLHNYVNPSASFVNPSASFVGGGIHTSAPYPPPPTVWPSVAYGARPPDMSSPDAWIDDLFRHHHGSVGAFRGHSRLPKLQLPKLTRDPLQWPRFIQAFGFQVDRTCVDDSERVAFLSCCLSDEIREELGSMLSATASWQLSAMPG